MTNNKTYLEEAEIKAKHAQILNPDDLYNFACVKALKGDLDAAQAALLHCEKTRYLPAKADLILDSDLDALSELDWFIDLLARQA